MAINSISENKGGGDISFVNIKDDIQRKQYTVNLQSINEIVKQVKEDLDNIKY
jgi:hypothetical protein